MASRQRFRRRIPATAALIQKRIKRLKSNPNRFVVNHDTLLISCESQEESEILRFVYFPTGPKSQVRVCLTVVGLLGQRVANQDPRMRSIRQSVQNGHFAPLPYASIRAVGLDRLSSPLFL
jgi:hypothetical protein